MHKIDIAAPTEYSIVIAETEDGFIPCIYTEGKFFRVNSLHGNALNKNRMSEKVIQWDYIVTHSVFKEKQGEIEALELNLLTSLMKKYKDKLIH